VNPPTPRRLHQIKRWLEREFPCSNIRLRVVSRMPKEFKGCLGVWEPTTRIIYIDKGQARPSAIYALLHEWAHARVRNLGWHNEEEEHGVHFDVEEGLIRRRWLDGGDVESGNY